MNAEKNEYRSKSIEPAKLRRKSYKKEEKEDIKFLKKSII